MLQLIDKKKKVAVYLIFFFILSTVSNKDLVGQKHQYILTDNIKVLGLSSNDNMKISSKLDELFSKNIITIDKEKINQVILQYNIVEEYSVKKIYPSRLEVQIKPTKLIARISSNSQLLVGANGKLILNEKNNKMLPYIFGEFNSKEFLKFKKNIDKSKFNFTDFLSISFYPSNRWDILTVNDILIKLPEDNLLTSLDVANKIIEDYQFKDSEIIDLRISNQLNLK
tara:strand:+ start:1143 stop:1820 length:678 start_codon:yes stop_codon:yes gene_type:complete